MVILYPTDFADYALLDSGEGKRLERFGKYTLVRPDPQAIWKPHLSKADWEKVDAFFQRTSQDRGIWQKNTSLPETITLQYQNISKASLRVKFDIKLTSFKHTGVFPEQAVHWKWIQEKIDNQSSTLNILNLFGYTGIASLVAAAAGAKVTHVDASRPTIGWARENQTLSGLQEKPIRWILDDALKFVQREVKRGVKYDGIIMDPPIYGHGPAGEVWDFASSFPKLMEACFQVLSDNPLFVIVNAYAISASSIMLENVLKDFLKDGSIESGELALKEQDSDRLLSTGIFARWSK